MANNRMYLRCKKCGEVLFLGKTYLDGYYTCDDYYKNNVDLTEAFNEFCDNHKWCSKEYNEEKFGMYEPKFKETNFSEENSFEIAYETYYDNLEKEVE